MGKTTALGSSGWGFLLGTFIILAILPACTSGQANWGSDFEEALDQATLESKFIVLDISASW